MLLHLVEGSRSRRPLQGLSTIIFIRFVCFQGVNIGLMNLTSNPLRSVADAAFAGARGIHSLLLGNCTLGSAPMAIGHLVNLTWLDLHNNSISRPTKEVFQPLLKLQHLDMSFNRRLELPSPFVSFNNLTKLLSLNLSSCGLSSLPTQVRGSEHDSDSNSFIKDPPTRGGFLFLYGFVRRRRRRLHACTPPLIHTMSP